MINATTAKNGVYLNEYRIIVFGNVFGLWNVHQDAVYAIFQCRNVCIAEIWYTIRTCRMCWQNIKSGNIVIVLAIKIRDDV